MPNGFKPSPFVWIVPPKCPPEAWANLFSRYPAIRLADAVVLLPGSLQQYSPRTRQREAQAIVEAGLAIRRRVAHRDVLVARAAAKLKEPTLIHHIQRGMLDAALVQDGYAISSGDRGRQALRAWLLAQPPVAGEDARLIAVARERIALMPSSGPRLAYTVAWRGTTTHPSDLRLSVVLHPQQAMKHQLEELPLRQVGQPRVPLILRSADDGTSYCRSSSKLVCLGPRYRMLRQAFAERRKCGGMFPYFMTSTLLDYRPDLWVRAQNL